jgi:hypothetical protein
VARIAISGRFRLVFLRERQEAGSEGGALEPRRLSPEAPNHGHGMQAESKGQAQRALIRARPPVRAN